MEDEIMEKASELGALILQSDEYRKYDECRQRLKENEELYQKVNEYREKNFQLQLNGEAENTHSGGKLADKYEEILDIHIVIEYLNAELMLCRRLQDISEVLLSGVDLDLDFL